MRCCATLPVFVTGASGNELTPNLIDVGAGLCSRSGLVLSGKRRSWSFRRPSLCASTPWLPDYSLVSPGLTGVSVLPGLTGCVSFRTGASESEGLGRLVEDGCALFMRWYLHWRAGYSRLFTMVFPPLTVSISLLPR
jgi:hypothetical protein